MTKNILNLIFLLTIMSASYGQTLVTQEDSIIHHSGIQGDSIEFIEIKKHGTPVHAYTFIDYNLKSKFHSKLISGYGCDCLEENFYNERYQKSFEKFKDSITVKLSDIKDIKGHWIPIYNYNDQFYFLYNQCTFTKRGFTISDTTLTQYYMSDGPMPSLLRNIERTDKVTEINDGYYQLITTQYLGIYVFQEHNDKMYVAHESALNKFPVIVVECHEMGAGGLRLKLKEPID